MAVRYIPPSKNVGDSVHDINYNFDYLDTHIEDVLQAAEDYADGRDAEFLAVSADYAEEKALQAQQAAQAYADSLVYIHPAYTARDINKVSGTQQITPGTPFTLAWFSTDNTGHVYQSGSSYFNIKPYAHPAYAEKDIGRETGVKQLTPGTTFTLPWVHVDAMGHVNQHGTSNFNITPYTHPAYTARSINYSTGTNQITPGAQFTLPWFDVDNTGHVYRTGSSYYNIGHDDSKADADHTHNYAGSDSVGGAATSANKLNTDAGSSIVPVYFKNGVPCVCQYTLGSMSAKDVADYLPISGGTLTGDVVIPSAKATLDNSLPASGSNISVTDVTDLKNYKSFIGSCRQSGRWFNLINVRHRNGYGDGALYGMYIKSDLTTAGDLMWNKQYWNKQYDSSWQGERTILDSGNYASYTVTKTGSGASGSWGINVTGSSGSCTGNSATATKLATARTINGVSFDGSANITIPLKNSASGTVLVDTSANANSLAITNAEIAKYSTVYMSASWTEQETVDFCDIVPIADIIAGAVFTKIIATGTRRYIYSVACTSAGLFTLTQSNSTGTAGTLRLKLYVI